MNGYVSFAFAVDIMQNLNDLNTKLQGKSAFTHELYQDIKACQLKLQLFAKQLNEQNVVHFPRLKHSSSQLVALQREFIRHFADFKAMEVQFELLSSPFISDIEETAEELQIELIDLQSDNTLKTVLKANHLLTFMLLCTQKN